jgi:hypothetical protein
VGRLTGCGAGELRRQLDRINRDIAAQELQLGQFRTLLKKLARASANVMASKGLKQKDFEALAVKFPVLNALSLGVAMTRFLSKGIILRIMTFAGGQTTTVCRGVSKAFRRIVEDERVWQVHCRQEIPEFKESELSQGADEVPLLRYNEPFKLEKITSESDMGDARAARAKLKLKVTPKRSYRSHFTMVVAPAATAFATSEAASMVSRMDDLRGGKGVRLVPHKPAAT